MPRYKITDPESGRSVIVTGDSPPTPEDIAEIFAQIGGAKSPPKQLPVSAAEMTKGALKQLGRTGAESAWMADPISVAAKAGRLFGIDVPQTPVESGAASAGEMLAPLPESDPNAQAQQIGATGANIGTMLAGGKGLGALGRGVMTRLPGVLGMAGRAATSRGGSAALGIGTGAEAYRRTGDPVTAVASGIGATQMLRGGRAPQLPGRGGAWQRLIGALRGSRGAPAPSGAAAPAVRGMGPSLGVRPGAAPPVPGGTSAARGMSRLGEALEAPRVVPRSATRPTVVGGSASSGGSTVARAGTPIGQARSPGAATTVPKAPTAESEAALLRLSTRLKDAPKELQQVAREVLQKRFGGDVLSYQTPSGAPSTLAKSLYEKYGATYGLNSPSAAQRFINMVLKAAE